MPAVTTRAELESRLRAASMRLVLRQAVRSFFSGVAAAAVALGLAVLFMDLLPRLLFGVTAGAGVLMAISAAGFALGTAGAWRRYRIPTLQETALSLQARLEHDSGALAAVLRVQEADQFLRPLLAQASGALSKAEHAPAPVLISTRRLILVPLLALVAAVGFAAVINSVPPTGTAPLASTPSERKRETWSNIDTGTTRTASDREAYRKALGLEETATTLSQSAATLRDADASAETRQRALDDAREAVADSDSEFSGVSTSDLPDELPAGAEAQAKLADKLERMASGLGAKAQELKEGKAGSTEDSGADGEFKVNGEARDLVPFPVVSIGRSDLAGEALATQTPARRALAERARVAYEKIQNR